MEQTTIEKNAKQLIINLKERAKKPTISIKKFREAVNSIEDDTARTIIETYYLTGARLCELNTVTNPCEILKGNTKPYGILSEIKIVKTELNPETGLVLVLQLATAKRGKQIQRNKKSKEGTEETITSEQIEATLIAFNQRALLKRWKEKEVEIDPQIIRALNNKPFLKAIALPICNVYEPWVKDLLRYYQKNHRLSFDYSRQELRKIIQRNLKGIVPKAAITAKGGSHAVKNILRHYRISHLIEYYNFNPVDITAYTGWTATTAFAAAGQTGGSNMVDEYLHLTWKSYFPKLCKPIDSLIKQS